MRDIRRPTPWEAMRYALRLGCVSFGGPAGQIALLTRELVQERRWLEDRAFLRALNLAMLLPGPEALQVVIYLGWRLYGRVGGIVAGMLFLGPGAVCLAVLSLFYAALGMRSGVAGALVGLQAAVVALVMISVLHLARRFLRSKTAWSVALISLLLVAGLHAPIPAVLLLGAGVFMLVEQPKTQNSDPGVTPIPVWPMIKSIVMGIGLWLFLYSLVALLFPNSIARTLFLTSSRVALGGFGGAYTMLAWAGQLFVQHHWISSAELTTGIGLAESTPGPLLLALQFYGFIAGWHAADLGTPISTAMVSAGLVSAAIFLPSFVLVLALAPAVEWLANRPRLTVALDGISAAVIGVVATFAIGIGQAVLLPGGHPAVLTMGIALAAVLLLTSKRLGSLSVLCLGMLAGLMLI